MEIREIIREPVLFAKLTPVQTVLHNELVANWFSV